MADGVFAPGRVERLVEEIAARLPAGHDRAVLELVDDEALPVLVGITRQADRTWRVGASYRYDLRAAAPDAGGRVLVSW